jgi:hypothetical protein
MVRRLIIILLLTCVAALAGCTHVQLRKNTIRQARTVSDIHLQQVMNNLAMFVYDPNSLPHFSFPSGSVSGVTDEGNLNFGLSWIVTGFDEAAFGGGASRSAEENFTMVPINDPQKLALMRCAYQTAVYRCGYGEVSKSCPECEALFEEFYGGPGHAGQTQRCLDEESFCWFHVGRRKDVPRHCPCQYVGHHCGVYVWVGPEGRDELVKLALAILDYAIYDPPLPATREVVRTVEMDEDGNVTSVTEETTYNEAIPDQYRGRRRSPVRGLDLLEFNQAQQTVQ